MAPLEFRGDFWHQKTRVPVLLYGNVCVILGLGKLIQCQLVSCDRHCQTDERTDKHTMTDSTVLP